MQGSGPSYARGVGVGAGTEFGPNGLQEPDDGVVFELLRGVEGEMLHDVGNPALLYARRTLICGSAHAWRTTVYACMAHHLLHSLGVRTSSVSTDEPIRTARATAARSLGLLIGRT